MGLFVNTNAASLAAQRSLLSSDARLRVSFRRLSSGLRINSAADDAAGLAIGERFTSQIRGLTQAARNANDGISMTQVAEGALDESTAILQRIRELSVQSASDINTKKDREAIQAEVDQLVDELNRIGDTTRFNETKVLDGSFINSFVHIGMNFREARSISVEDARATYLGRHAVLTGNPVSTLALAGDLLVNGVTIRGTQATDDTVSTSLVTSSAIAKASAINDFSEFTKVEAYVSKTQRDGVGAVQGGTLDQGNHIIVNGHIITGINVAAGDAGDTLISHLNAEAPETGVVARRGADGQIELTAEDGRNIEVESVGLGGTITGLRAAAAGADVTLATLTLHSEDQYVLGDIGAVVGRSEAALGFANNQLVGVSDVQVMSTVDVTTREGANLTLLVVDRAIQQVTRTRTRLGAIQNRLEATVSNLAAVTEQVSAARSRIVDADFAVESAGLARNQILQQAATTVLAQANAQSQSALSLLQ